MTVGTEMKTLSPVDLNNLDSLGIVVVTILYTCAWLSARENIKAWAESIDEELTPVTPGLVAWSVISALCVMWAWLLLIVVLLLNLQSYFLVYMRPGKSSGTSSHGTAFSICFGVLSHWNVLAALGTSIIATYIFAWVSTRRALSHPKKSHRSQIVMECISNSMTFNLIVVVVTLVLCGAQVPKLLEQEEPRLL